jgi:hypothetical protein
VRRRVYVRILIPSSDMYFEGEGGRLVTCLS